MFEDHRIVEVAAEPLPAGCVGVRACARLSGRPSRRWARDLAARLVNELVGHRAIGHLRLNDIVRCDQIVLDGIESAEAASLAGSLQRAIERTNRIRPERRERTANVPQASADEIAHQIALVTGCAVTAAASVTGDHARESFVPNGWFG